MDVNPISLQMVVPRTNDASQVQHNLNQQGNIEQAFAMVKDQNDVQMKMETVQGRDETEDGRIKDDPNRRGNGGYSGSRREKKDDGAEGEERMAVDILRGHNIDISF